MMVINNDNKLPLSLYIGVLGMPGNGITLPSLQALTCLILGKTAYYGLTVIGQPKKGETIYVSTGAGPVGA
jgi:NADPH-dependent curcumin reductase CurA